ncbi:MAG: hypothetical protein A2428_10220 [Bdellovibrionales bacterium RIFOXYC1_FULL_54_43]|nr:MAG: hypothetical protein A2428_10220 [Bdellovibrionales bacterium RIFOXYC1_FULL_54_43]OFZ80506.1 MAG: hypothetical protein A2603_13035 [Bdellovibrionales bacterium RIFOXYD1_FULL_55_31]
MQSPDTSATIPSSGRRWFAFLGAGLAWTFHLLTIYVIGEFGCVSGFDQQKIFGISSVAWLLIATTAIALIPAAMGTIIAYHDWRRDGASEGSSENEGGRYLSSYGFVLSALFVLIILVESLPIFGYLDSCGTGH